MYVFTLKHMLNFPMHTYDMFKINNRFLNNNGIIKTILYIYRKYNYKKKKNNNKKRRENLKNRC